MTTRASDARLRKQPVTSVSEATPFSLPSKSERAPGAPRHDPTEPIAAHLGNALQILQAATKGDYGEAYAVLDPEQYAALLRRLTLAHAKAIRELDVTRDDLAGLFDAQADGGR